MKKFLSFLLAAIMAAGMTTSVFAAVGDAENTAMNAIDSTGLTVITPSSMDLTNAKYVKLVGANIGTAHYARGVHLMDNDCTTYWVMWGEAGQSPTLHLLLNNPMPVDKVFIAFPWDAATDATTSAFPSATYGVAVYATFVDGTVERLTYTGNTITADTTARAIELTNKTKAVKMISVSRVPRNTLDNTAGFWDNVPGTKVAQALSISEIKIYTPTSSLPIEDDNIATTITKDGTAVTCLSDGYTAGVANMLLGNTSNPLSSHSDMLALNVPAAQYFDPYYKFTNNGAVLTGDSEVTLAAGEHILVDLGKYSYISEVEVAADNYAGLTVKGGNMSSSFDDADTLPALAQNTDGLYSSTVTEATNRYRYIAIYNNGDTDVKLSEVAVKATNNDPTITRNKGLRAWYNSTWYETAEGGTVPAANCYVWTQDINVPVAENQKYTVLLVLYDENGKMIEPVSTEVTMDATTKKVDLMTGNGSIRATARKAKVMLIDSLTNGMIYATEEYTIAPAQ
ncbi:MAG: hypothetical protein IJ300_14195 [Clostridia bacterium]|nr:hypothetical protein [Clostridia bacterium]